MRDFTPDTYRRLVVALRDAGYQFLTLEQYCTTPPEARPERYVLLRHDVDLAAPRSRTIAEIEHAEGAVASYYFRVVRESNQPEVIRAIASLGHEVGYHYEDMALCHGDVARAHAHFEEWLAYFRTYYPVRTVCMHGAPTSRYDGRELWKHYSYRDSGIVGEPYFDVDFAELFYLTDTGRMWDGYRVSVRDKIPVHQDRWCSEGQVYHSTENVLSAIASGRLPRRLMITTHPQRWCAEWSAWLSELMVQRVKNIVKRVLITLRR